MGIPRGTPGKSLNRYGQFTLASCIWQTLAHDELGNTGMITTSPVIECALDAGIPHERQGGIPHDPTSSSVAPGNRICCKHCKTQSDNQREWDLVADPSPRPISYE